MARYQLLRNHENDDDVAAFRRLAMFHRQNARDIRNQLGNELDLMMAPFGNVRAAVAKEARYERVTVHGNTLRYIDSFTRVIP